MQQVLGAAGTLGSLVLVGVTIWYAWQTQQMVREMRDARVATVRPSLHLDLGGFTGAASVDIENLGVGPAVDVSVDLVVASPQGELERRRWTTPLMRSGDRKTMLMPNKDGVFGRPAPVKEWADMGAVIRMSGVCRDLDSREHAVDDILDFSAHSDRGPEGNWEGVEERLPKNVERIAKELERIGDGLNRS